MGWEGKLRSKKDEAEGDAKDHVGMAAPDAEMEQEGRADDGVSNLRQADQKDKEPFGKE